MTGLERRWPVGRIEQPCGLDGAVATLRDDLAEIGLMLQDAVPRKSVEALESEVRKLADRIDHIRSAGTGVASWTLVSLSEEVRTLARKVDQALPSFSSLEERIGKLVEKLDASDARLNHLETIEHGLTQLLMHLENQRVPRLAQARASSKLPELEAPSPDNADLETESKAPDALDLGHDPLGPVPVAAPFAGSCCGADGDRAGPEACTLAWKSRGDPPTPITPPIILSKN